MVTRYGMSKKFGLVGLATVESQYLDGRAALNCSDETAAQIDAEVVAIIKESYDKALAMLRENRELMDKLAEFLIEKETITGKEFMEIFRREKGLPEPEEKKDEDDKESEALKKEAEKPAEEAEAEVQAEEAVDAKEDMKAEDDSNSDGQAELPPYLRYQEPPSDDSNRGRFSNGKLE